MSSNKLLDLLNAENSIEKLLIMVDNRTLRNYFEMEDENMAALKTAEYWSYYGLGNRRNIKWMFNSMFNREWRNPYYILRVLAKAYYMMINDDSEVENIGDSKIDDIEVLMVRELGEKFHREVKRNLRRLGKFYPSVSGKKVLMV